MNTIDGIYIGYLLAALHTLDIFSTSRSTTSKNAHQARVQAIIANIDISWLKSLKKWGQKCGDCFEPVLNTYMPLSPTFYPIFLVSPSLTQYPPPKKLFLGTKNMEGAFALPLSPLPKLCL